MLMHTKKVAFFYADYLLLHRPSSNDHHTAIIQAMLEQRNVKVWSFYNKNMTELKQALLHVRPDIIGIVINSPPNVLKLIDFLDDLKKSGLKFKVIAYGAFPTGWGDHIEKKKLKGFDFLIKGEPERVFCEIINDDHLLQEAPDLRVYEELTPIKNLDELPFPKVYSRDELNTRIARGCFHNCLFCYERYMFKSFRYRGVKNVLNEIGEFLQQKDSNDIPWVFFSDLDLLAVSQVSPLWFQEFANGVKERGYQFHFTGQTRADRIGENIDVISTLKSVGLSAIALGIESGSSRVLKLFNKRDKGINSNKHAVELLQRLGLPVKINYIMYEPLTTLSDLKANVEFLKSINFPQGMIPSQLPVSAFDRVRIMMGTPSYSYYTKVPNLAIWERDYLIHYEFLHKETQDYYGFVLMWRKMNRLFLRDYYHALNQILYPSTSGLGRSSEALKIKVLHLGHAFKRLDLQLMDDLTSGVNQQEIINRANEKLSALHDRLFGLKVIDRDSNSSFGFRGWHGNLRYLIDNEIDTEFA